MKVLAEKTSPPLRARLVACDCGEPGCTTVFIVMQLVESRPLWLAMGVSVRGEEAAEESVDAMLDDPMRDVGGMTLRHMIEAGLAIVGVTWEELVVERARLEAQILAWSSLPRWMEKMPAGLLWQTRGVVWGRPLTRVPRALYAFAKYYVPEGPEAYEDFDQGAAWGVATAPGSGKAVLVRWMDAPVRRAFLLDPSRWDS